MLFLGLIPCSAAAQQITTSPKPESVAVTIYRTPNRDAATPLNRNWLNGYALITETRRVDIPAGEGVIRFEGVAGGIMPESAIVTGLPDGVVEKNQDAWLLSPGSLLQQSLGRPVQLRRTAPDGTVREQEAVIRSGAAGAVVLQTPDGFEALRCSGVNETIVYPEVPEGLSAKPTLSVRTRSDRAASAILTLTYLAMGFDWQADYVATLAPGGERMELFAWVTLASTDQTSFPDAHTQAVAGRVNREYYEPSVRAEAPSLNLRCWPSATTSDILSAEDIGGFPPPPPPPPPAMAASAESIVVTGRRVARKAVQEELGDLKLYRLPDRVTVAANNQKQVAMLERPSVKVATIYRYRFYAGSESEPVAAQRVLATRNRGEEGLGLPLPAGRVALFAAAGADRPLLLGQGYVDDKAVGEDVEIELSEAPGVRASVKRLKAWGGEKGEYELVVTSDRGEPVRFEALIAAGELRFGTPTRLAKRDGDLLWAVTVPPNGSARLRYRLD